MRSKSSSSNSKSAFGIPLGEPSPAAQEAQQRIAEIRALAEGEGPAPDSVEHELIVAAEAVPTVNRATVKTLRTQKIILDSALFTLELEVYDVQIQPNFICFSMPITTSVIQPKDLMHMDLVCGGRRHPVVYVGGYFELPQHGLKAMSFLRDIPKESENDKKRKSANQENPIDPDGEAGH